MLLCPLTHYTGLNIQHNYIFMSFRQSVHMYQTFVWKETSPTDPLIMTQSVGTSLGAAIETPHASQGGTLSAVMKEKDAIAELEKHPAAFLSRLSAASRGFILKVCEWQ